MFRIKKDKLYALGRDNIILLIAIATVIVMAFVRKEFTNGANLRAIMAQMPSTGFAALALTFILICGEFDISQGSIMAVAAALLAILTPRIGFYPAMTVSVLGCGLFGVISGTLITLCSLNSFIVSVAFMFGLRGVALILTDSDHIVIEDSALQQLATGGIGAITNSMIIFIVAVLMVAFVLRYTRYGRNMYAIGGNRAICENLGIPVRRTKFTAMIVYNMMCAMGGIMLVLRTSSAVPTMGTNIQLNTIPMVVVGGTALSGGKGGAIHTLLGVFFMTLLFNSMSLFHVKADVQDLVKGLILLMVVIFNKYTANKDKKI